MKEKIRKATKRKDPTPTREKIRNLEATIEGWVNYFRIAMSKRFMLELDKMVRHRLRMGIWKQWKNPKTRIKNLMKLGISKGEAHRWGTSSHSYCRVARQKAMKIAINTTTLQRAGYTGFYNRYHWKSTHQLKLF